ncbi:hypothetical protein D0N36_09310 [Hymenobacter lapidiphilus]|uniref:hypothetical protein n=1 Tax=Hymenobacter sp. CCM 8763 TaxID=2303334 RepID=UPI000E342569|nr:hypothetical protein [Hymenobacter sp. CCM 8763]RFP65254.1 hypothetical protein D0N36_09310 [Hymenobacter sp. CCM 8763]
MFSFKNFYKSATATVQRAAALLKIGGGALSTASASELVPARYKLLAFLCGLVVCAVAEGLEKLSAAPPPASGPDPATDSTMSPQAPVE